MIIGAVDPRRRSVVALVVLGADGGQETISTLLDTGYNGALMLPAARVEALGLTPVESVTIRLANGSRERVPVYLARVLWDGEERNVSVLAAGNQPLLGTTLLLGYRLMIEMVDGGAMTIERL